MTRQEKKNFLRKYPHICDQIERINNRIEEIRTAGEKITQSYSEVGYSSCTDSKVERAAVKVPHLEADLKKKIDEKTKIDNALRSLRINQREILKMVYFDGISQNRVAQILHKTPNTIRNVVNHAIDCIIL